ncbi:hypothetical protein BV22DRAFT_1121229 [Leucogyrophana mollusca]|uniref:Uncharacterized protein n=1 Tax=Leucogyrophana mollusca TaxID=85980 RepID=A0ACB8BAJ3_9AGAM|nr:hypothetical protein BV22DRAFT_1121229 [Leucogyrophana mollusca]
MSESPLVLAWGPSLIGSTLGLWMYGIALGQYGFYLRAFPLDRRALKILVLLVFIMDTLHTYGIISYQWGLFLYCHHNASFACLSDLPWEVFMCVALAFGVTFVVHSFFAHRVWIISGRNSWITAAVSVTALAQFVLGMACAGEVIRTKNVTVLFDALSTAGSSAALSVVCDLLITGSIFFYLRPQRSGIKRREATIQRLIYVCVNMGLFTCLGSLVMLTLYLVQGQQYLIGAISSTLCKSYVNSMLAVLNARKFIRECSNATKTIELPTIPTSEASTAEASSSGYPG